MRKRNRNPSCRIQEYSNLSSDAGNNGSKIKRKDYRINLKHLAHTKYVEQAKMLKGLIYMADSLGNKGFFEEAFVPSLMLPAGVKSKDCSIEDFIKGSVRIYWKREVEEELRKAIIEKCLEFQ